MPHSRITYYLLLLTWLLASCAKSPAPNFSSRTAAAPDTAHHRFLVCNIGFVSDDTDMAVRGQKMLDTYLAITSVNAAAGWDDVVWRPAPEGSQSNADTLWLRPKGDEAYVCLLQCPRPDFSLRGTSRGGGLLAADKSGASSKTAPAWPAEQVRSESSSGRATGGQETAAPTFVVLLDSVNNPVAAERGITMWQRFVLLHHMMESRPPRQLVWQPSDGRDPDTLWIEISSHLYALVSPRHPVNPDSLTTAEDILRRGGGLQAADESGVSHKTATAWPSIICYILLTACLVACLVAFLVHRYRRGAALRGGALRGGGLQAAESTTASAPSLEATSIVLDLKRLAATGTAATPSALQQLQTAVASHYPAFVPRLREGHPAPTEAELHICLLLLAGFLPTEISNLLSCPRQHITDTCARLNAQLFGPQSPVHEFDARLRALAGITAGK